MLFDTNIFIYLEKQNAKAIKLISETENIKISAVTYMELMQGSGHKNKVRIVEKLLETFQIRIIEIGEGVSVAARILIKQYAQSHGLSMGDALIAATALYADYELVTANYKDFRFIEGLTLKKFMPAKQP